MKLISLSRGMGKTTKLLKWLLKDPNHRMILVHSRPAKDYLIRYLTENKLYPDKIKYQNIETWDDFLNFKGWPAALHDPDRKPLEIAVDNADIFIKHHFGKYGNPIELVTFNKDMSEEKWRKLYNKHREKIIEASKLI